MVASNFFAYAYEKLLLTPWAEPCYNVCTMKLTTKQKAELTETVKTICRRQWHKFVLLYPELQHFEMPEIVLNGRLKTTAGRCYQTLNRIEFGTGFWLHSTEYTVIMSHEIVPHELAHQVDFNLYGESEKKCGHGKTWNQIMLNYGLAPKRFHRMDKTQ